MVLTSHGNNNNSRNSRHSSIGESKDKSENIFGMPDWALGSSNQDRIDTQQDDIERGSGILTDR